MSEDRSQLRTVTNVPRGFASLLGRELMAWAGGPHGYPVPVLHWDDDGTLNITGEIRALSVLRGIAMVYEYFGARMQEILEPLPE